MTGPDLAAALAGILLGLGMILAMWWVGSSEETSWDDAHERRNGDR